MSFLLFVEKVKPNLSAGRVQSVTVKLIVQREQEIADHKPVETFKVVANFDYSGVKFKAELSSNLASKNEAITFLNSLKDKDFKVVRVTKKPGKRTPSAPFITSTLQQEASRVLGLVFLEQCL